jgi:ABC-type transport system involved in multi-copper enzyme maturation permease subunit
MIGPVLSFELLRAGRRGWHRTLLWVYAAWLLFVTGVLFLMEVAHSLPRLGLGLVGLPPDHFAEFCVMLVELLVGQQFLLVLLATPAFAAGSVSDEKTRGTLQEWLTTDLTAWEILRGKLGGQLAILGTLSLALLPLLAFFGAFAGMDLLTLAMVVCTVALQVLALTAASLLASVWCRRTTTAVLSVYLAGAAAYALLSLIGWEEWFGPLYLLEPVWLNPDPGAVPGRLLRAGLAWGGLVALCLALATWRLRPAYLRQLAAEGVRGGNYAEFARRPEPGNQPLRWKERYLGEVPALPVARLLPRELRIAAVAATTAVVAAMILLAHLPPAIGVGQLLRMVLDLDVARLARTWAASAPADVSFLLFSLAALALFSLGVGIRCAGAISSERERKTWDMLLTTPLEPRQILRGKLWGVIDSTRPYLVAYLVPAAVLALAGGVLALVWVVFWWLATWLMMYYMGATGVYCSVRSQNSWRSLLATLMSNAWTVAMRYVMIGAPVGLLVSGGTVTLFQVAATVFGGPLLWRVATFLAGGYLLFFFVVSSGIALVAVFAEAEAQLTLAERWVWKHERVTPPEARVVKG